MTTAAIYCRVSSTQQEFDGTSLDTQEAAARAYAADHGYTVAARHVYREAHSGADLHERAHLTALRTAARAGEFDIVICHAVDRLSRNQAHLYIVAEELERAGVRLEFVTEDFADSAVGKFIRSAKALAAEVEREKFRERSERGKRERVRLGKLMHGKWPVYGYDWRDTRRGAYVADPATAPIVQRVFREALAGTPTRRIATGLTGEGIPAPRGGSRWEPTTVLYILNNRMYTGEAFAFRTKRVKVPGRKWGQILKLPPEEWVPLPAGTVPPLVDAATFEAVQERLRLNKARAGRRNSGPESFLLRAGIARCGYCGYAMSVKRNPDGNHQYVCVRNSKGRGLCPRAVISTRKLDRAVWASIRERMTHPEQISEDLALLQREDPTAVALPSVERALADVSRRQANISRALGDLDEDAAAPLVAELKQLADQRRQFEAERERLRVQRSEWERSQTHLAEIADWCRVVDGVMDDWTYDQRRRFLDAIGLQIRVFKADRHPRWEADGALPHIRPPDTTPATGPAFVPCPKTYTRTGCS